MAGVFLKMKAATQQVLKWTGCVRNTDFNEPSRLGAIQSIGDCGALSAEVNSLDQSIELNQFIGRFRGLKLIFQFSGDPARAIHSKSTRRYPWQHSKARARNNA
jgi:hypothetical protein